MPAAHEQTRMTLAVAVRELCQFTARAGDLDLRFTPAPSALEGIAGHAEVTARRPSGYKTEIALAGEHAGVAVRGRADGYDPALGRLEEIKTYRGDIDAIRDNHRALHWAQALMYGHLLCAQRGLAELEVALVYFNVATRRETVLVQRHDAAALRAHFALHCERYRDWARAEAAHRQARDAALEALAFPHGGFRTGQRELAVAVYKTARERRCLLAQAPTGIGKTVGTLFPLLKACPGEKLDKILFLTAKGPGRALALEALDTLARSGARPLRVLDLVARDAACVEPGKACHGDSCPRARGFYDRLPAARAGILAVDAPGRLDRDRVRDAALAHGICPYYLSQELARWSDVIVADYNHYFDTSAMLYALARASSWRVAVLVDEAHNMVDRARAMYTGELSQDALARARKAAPASLRSAFTLVTRRWNALAREQTQPYQACAEPPAELLGALQGLSAALSAHLADAPLPPDDPLLRVHFDLLHFLRLAEQHGPHSLFDMTLGTGPAAGATLCLRNVVPAPFLAPRYEAAQTTVLFSGTLAPPDYLRDMLGLPDGTPWLDVTGPFRAEQLTVRIAGNISTRFRDRERSLTPIAALIARQYAERPGNYLGFFSSFDYLARAAALLRERHPEVLVWTQDRFMDADARAAFLARFAPEGRGVGLAVLGGAFAEGVDLPGSRLVGAFVATLGLPQVNPVNEQMMQALQALYGPARAYDYAYLYPGLQKVVQAAGRVIRTESDQGTLHLIDDRYRQDRIRRMMPSWWRLP